MKLCSYLLKRTKEIQFHSFLIKIFVRKMIIPVFVPNLIKKWLISFKYIRNIHGDSKSNICFVFNSGATNWKSFKICIRIFLEATFTSFFHKRCYFYTTWENFFSSCAYEHLSYVRTISYIFLNITCFLVYLYLKKCLKTMESYGCDFYNIQFNTKFKQCFIRSHCDRRSVIFNCL